MTYYWVFMTRGQVFIYNHVDKKFAAYTNISGKKLRVGKVYSVKNNNFAIWVTDNMNYSASPSEVYEIECLNDAEQISGHDWYSSKIKIIKKLV